MTQTAKKNEITFDVKGKTLGRAASQVAVLLRGKDSPDFEPRIRPTKRVKILNVSDLKLYPTKLRLKKYKRYSGYPSGLKEIKASELLSKNPRLVFKKAVFGMLPKNKSRQHTIKNLAFE